MAARALGLILLAELRQARRRLVAGGVGRLLGVVGAGVALVGVEAWVANRAAARLLAVPVEAVPLAHAVLVHGATLMCQLALMVATASAVTVALPVLETLEVDPWWAASPLPPTTRAAHAWWRVAGGLGWVVVLGLPPLIAIAHRLVPGARAPVAVAAGFVVLLGVAAAAGLAAALLLAALVPRRILVPAAWTTTTAAVVGAVLWLRHLRPERLATATEPLQLLVALAGLGGSSPANGIAGLVTGVLVGRARPGPLLALTVATSAVLLVVWRLLGPRAAHRLAAGTPGQGRPLRWWTVLDRSLLGGPVGVLAAGRLRLLARDAVQASQTLYLLGLGAVYVENLRALPLGDPLARELAGLVNLAMAGLLAAAMALRFAYPAALLEGAAAWWWRSGPVSRGQALAASFAVAVLPPLGLACALYFGALAVTGAGHTAAFGWWLVPWEAVWLTALGVALGPEPDAAGDRSWLEAALGSGGMLFLAAGVAGVGWATLAAGRQVLAAVTADLGLEWRPGVLAGHPLVPAAILSLLTLPLLWRRLSRAG